jgi:hypothetical protein
MDIYIDRTIEFGQLLPPGAADLTLDVGQHVFHLALPECPGESLPVRLSAATYCGVTDVLQFIVEVLPANGSWNEERQFDPRDNESLRRVQLSELLPAPLDTLPRLSFDTERLNASANEGLVTRAQALARGLLWEHTPDGRVAVSPDPQVAPRVLTGWLADTPSRQLKMSNQFGRQTDEAITPHELRAETRREALILMQARQQAISAVDAMHSLQPTLRAISRARHDHIERADPESVRKAVERHRERSNLEVARLLEELRNAD